METVLAPEGWMDISPGPNLEGWREFPWTPGEKAAAAPLQWHMNVGTGVLLCDGTMHTHLLTEATYQDFILHVEWRFLAPGENYNSDVFVRMTPEHRVMHQIETRRGKVGVVMGGTLVDGDLTFLGAAQPGRSGQWRAVCPHVPRAWHKHVSRTNPIHVTRVPEALGSSIPTVVHPQGKWNTYEITCTENMIVVRTNGTVSSATDNCLVGSGSVGFESEGYPIEFRNMRLKQT
jgi:hypothetical protein